MGQQYSGTYDGTTVNFKCYKGGDDQGCMERIEAGTDHLTVFGGKCTFLPRP
jgi:hypothetical protein